MAESIVAWATQLTRELAPDDNVYGSHPTIVRWSGDVPHERARNRSVCSSFASRLLERTYGYTASDVAAWFGVAVPQARDYHRAIVRERGFTRVFHAWAILPGDVIAIAYPAGSRPTGHVMLAVSRARRRESTEPIVEDTVQYEIDVIDSAASGHGPGDTRALPHGRSRTGAGRGTLRVYVARDDATAGHTWSTLAISTFRAERVRRLAIGRYDAASAPAPSGVPGGPGLASDGPVDDAAPEEQT